MPTAGAAQPKNRDAMASEKFSRGRLVGVFAQPDRQQHRDLVEPTWPMAAARRPMLRSARTVSPVSASTRNIVGLLLNCAAMTNNSALGGRGVKDLTRRCGSRSEVRTAVVFSAVGSNRAAVRRSPGRPAERCRRRSPPGRWPADRRCPSGSVPNRRGARNRQSQGHVAVGLIYRHQGVGDGGALFGDAVKSSGTLIAVMPSSGGAGHQVGWVGGRVVGAACSQARISRRTARRCRRSSSGRRRVSGRSSRCRRASDGQAACHALNLLELPSRGAGRGEDPFDAVLQAAVEWAAQTVAIEELAADDQGDQRQAEAVTVRLCGGCPPRCCRHGRCGAREGCSSYRQPSADIGAGCGRLRFRTLLQSGY